MDTDDITAAIAAAMPATRADARVALDAILAAIKAAVINGQSVHLVDLGTFTPKLIPSRASRNLRTNTPIIVPAKVQLLFSASESHRAELN